MLISISREVATKDDIKKLSRDLKSYIEVRVSGVNARIDDLSVRINDINTRISDINMRVSDLYGVVKASLVAIVVTLASTILVPLILKAFFLLKQASVLSLNYRGVLAVLR